MNQEKTLRRLVGERNRWVQMADHARAECGKVRAQGGSRSECYLLELEARACAERAERLAERIAAAPALVEPSSTFRIERRRQ